MAIKKKYRMPRDYEDVGAYLQTLRVRKDLTQRDVSNALGYSSAQFISNFERGIAFPPLKKLKIMLEIYEAKPDRLLELTIDSKRKILMKGLQSSTRSRGPQPQL